MPASPANADQPYHPQPMAATGRIGRVHFWGWSTMLALAVLALVVAFNALSEVLGIGLGLLDDGLTGASVVGAIVLARRRVQDMGTSEWWALAIIVPLVNFGVLVWLSVAPGQAGSNRYGPQPAPASRAFVVASIGATVVTIAAVLAIAYLVMQALSRGSWAMALPAPYILREVPDPALLVPGPIDPQFREQVRFAFGAGTRPGPGT